MLLHCFFFSILHGIVVFWTYPPSISRGGPWQEVFSMESSPFHVRQIAFNRTYELLSSRWKVYLVYAIGRDTYRTGQLRRMFPSVSRVTLTTYLQELERDGFVRHVSYPAPPLRVEYSLTPLGLGVWPILARMVEWGAEH